MPSVYATHSAWLSLYRFRSPDWVSALNPSLLNRPQVANTSGVICHIKAMAQRSWLVSNNPFSNTSVPFIAQVKNSWARKLSYCIIAVLTHMPFSICGTTVAEQNPAWSWTVVVLLPAFAGTHSWTPAPTEWFICSSHLLNMAQKLLFWFEICWWPWGLRFPDTAVLILLWEQE